MASHDLPAVYFPPEVARVERDIEEELPLRQQLEQRMEQLIHAAQEKFGIGDFTTREVESIARDLLFAYDYAQEDGRSMEYRFPGSFLRLSSDPSGGNAAESAQQFVFRQLVLDSEPSIAEINEETGLRFDHRHHYYATSLPGHFFIQESWEVGKPIHQLHLVQGLRHGPKAYQLAGPVQK